MSGANWIPMDTAGTVWVRSSRFREETQRETDYEELAAWLRRLSGSLENCEGEDKLLDAADAVARVPALERVSREEVFAELLRSRGVETPCKTCIGTGRRMYGSTSTWRGGMGGCTCTQDVCDRCWGTGDENERGANLRAARDAVERARRESAVEYLASHLGCGIGDCARYVVMLAELAEKQANKRKLPDGEHPFWWHERWRALGAVLRRVAGSGR